MSDWIDREYERRQRGITSPLTQSEHQQVNARYEGCTLEYCCDCGEATGHAGIAEDSIYTEEGHGPLCDTCAEDYLGADQ